MSMTMRYEYINPALAKALLEKNGGNRRLSKGTIQAYTQDILSGNWDENVGSSIAIDEDGILRDGQHRLAAIVNAGKGFHAWVCRGVDPDGIYDNNRKRSNSDQISITRPDLDNVYKSTRFISVARTIIQRSTYSKSRRTVTPKELIEFIDEHKEDLDGFFLVFPQQSVTKISIAVVILSLFMAYMGGVDINDILAFYDVLRTGMSTKPEHFPIIAYRNYLKDYNSPLPTDTEIARCQYALKKYLSGSCVKRTISPNDLIWPFPYSMKTKGGNA